jgi:hypothetical protein
MNKIKCTITQVRSHIDYVNMYSTVLTYMNEKEVQFGFLFKIILVSRSKWEQLSFNIVSVLRFIICLTYTNAAIDIK